LTQATSVGYKTFALYLPTKSEQEDHVLEGTAANEMAGNGLTKVVAWWGVRGFAGPAQRGKDKFPSQRATSA